MGRVAYLLDANAVSDYINQFEPTKTRIHEAIRAGDTLYLCDPVRYEVKRGLIRANATTKTRIFEETFAPLLAPLPVTNVDWEQAAQYWADTKSKGKQLSGVDLLIATLSTRLNAVIVSADADFDALPVQREDWRVSEDDES